MDNKQQDHNNTATGGARESHGHLCHKCGWPFPNPHPSAKQRRAHKRHCGSIQGYKLYVDMDVDPTLSDDDLPKTPSPKLVGKSDCEKPSGGIGEKSNRSEDEFFSDAVTEFSGSGFSPGIEERPKDATVAAATDVQKSGEKDLTVFYSFKDKAITDIIEPSSNSTFSGQKQSPEVPENATALPGSNLVSQVNVSSTTEESAGEDVREGLMKNVGQETDANGSGKIDSDGNVVPFFDSEYPGQTSMADYKCQEIENMTTDPMPAAEVVLSKEEHGVETTSKMCLAHLVPVDESVKLSDAADTTQKKLGADQGLDFTSSVDSNEDFSGKERGNENVYELSVPADIPMLDHAEMVLGGFKDHKGLKLRQHVTLDNENVNELSVPADITVVDHAETMLEDFKDHNGVKLPQPVTLDSCEIITEKVSASDVHAVEDILFHKGSLPVVEKPSTKEENDEPQIKLTRKEGSDELEVSAAAAPIGMEKRNAVSSMEKPSVVSDDSLQISVQETAVKVLSDVNPIVAPLEANAMSLYDTVSHENSTTETYDVVEKNERERVKEEYFAKNIITTDSASDLPDFQANLTTNLHESDDAADHEKCKIKKCGVAVESKEEPSEGNLLLESKTVSETDNNLHEAPIVAKDVRDVSLMKLSETKLTDVSGVSDTQDVPRQLEVNYSDKAQGGYDATKAPLLSPSDTEFSMQGSVAVDDNCAVEQGIGHSGINQTLQGENGDNNFVKHQFGASVVDVSVDSLSQTDSLEGNWGSISVLSTQSDIPSVVDAENLSSADNLASAEAKKLNSKKPEAATERQHSEKSDVFEAPSFMTLVEPGSGSDEKAAVSDIETVQNLEQQKASSQAGWFPSLTHVVNDSQGRKKNEERIAKVTNWSTGKQHTPLKSLLGEANLETKLKSPKPKENKAPVIKKDETVVKDNGAVPMTVSAILGPEVPATEPAKRETGKEVNSPARYPADIKREKRKVKGRPYWVQFVCCSSVN